MPWQTPLLSEVRALVRDAIRAYLPGADAMVPNSVLRVLSDNQGALCHLTLQYLDWLALQLMPDTAEQEWLDRHGNIWLVNADGSTGRKVATLSEGTATVSGLGGTVVAKGTQLTYSAVSMSYETLADVTCAADNVATEVAIRALDPGSLGNLDTGTALSVINAPDGLNSAAVVVALENGTDEELDDDLRIRVLERIRQPPMGGAQNDYVAWAKAVPGVTRAWAASEMGIGTVSVRFMMDQLRADNDGFPIQSDIDAVTEYIDLRRPVTTKDRWIMSPTPQRIDLQIANLVPDTEANHAAIEASLQAMLRRYASPGQTIFAAWKYYALMSVASVTSFDLLNPTDDKMLSAGHMAVLGDITYTVTTPTITPLNVRSTKQQLLAAARQASAP
jgi:uncharacterized phage protein gp47/JayE